MGAPKRRSMDGPGQSLFSPVASPSYFSYNGLEKSSLVSPIKERILRLNLYFGLSCLAFSGISLSLGFPFMKRWFYCFAWWALLLVLDSLNFRRLKYSPLFKSLENFLFIIFLSVFIWLVFELFNLRLKNWSYHSLPQNDFERWLGYFLGFTTVIPALEELALLIQSVFKEKRFQLIQIYATPILLKTSIALGFLFILFIFVWPGAFFPLTWLCFIFLLEPINYARKNNSFLKDLERNDARQLLGWSLAGLLAGFIWEFLNSWAGSHWEYHLPYFNFWRVFQMPVFGYGGFLPFALEVFAIYAFFSSVYKRIKPKLLLKISILIFMGFFDLICFYLIDSLTWVH